MVSLTRLRMVRERRALTQQQLAERAGVNRVTIARLERGRDDPFPTTVRKLADALGVEPEELMEQLAGEPRVRPLHRGDASSRHTERGARPAPGPTGLDTGWGRGIAMVDGEDVHRLLGEEPGLAALVREAADRLVTSIPDARLSLELLVDPDNGECEQLFLGVTTNLQEGDALEALRRFDQEWWVRQAHRARGRLCIDLRDA
jgi:transcriptional regulator with XRE-family HTH domain